MDIFPQKYIQHGTARGSLGLAVIAAALDLLPVADDKGGAVVGSIPVFFLHLRDEGQSLLLGFHRPGRGDEAGFFLDELPFPAFI